MHFSGGLRGGGRFGTTVDVDPKDLLGRVKVEVCEREGVEARTKLVIRDPKKADGFIAGSANERHSGRWRLDPLLSFEENTIFDGDLLVLVDNPATSSICPICLERREPLEPLPFYPPFDHVHSIESRYHCKRCDWHWKVFFGPDGRIVTEDEQVYLIIGARALGGTYHHSVTSDTRVGSVLEYLFQRYGTRKADREGLLDRDRFRLQLNGERLDNQSTFASLGVHYFGHLDLVKDS